MPVITVDLRGVTSLINRCYQPYLKDFRRFQVFKGGAGAGKSVFLTEKIITNVIEEDGYNVMVVRKVGRDNHNSTFAELLKCIHNWDFDDLFEVNHSNGQEEIVCRVNRNKIIFRGLDNVQKIKSVTFETGDLTAIWVEEASEIIEEDFNQLDLRLRGEGRVPKHLMMSFNPIDVGHFVKRRLFDRTMDPDEGFVCETTYKDNRFIDSRYKKELEGYKDIDLYYYQVYTLNQWGARTTATVFRNVVIEDFDVREIDLTNKRLGMDFGWEHANALEGVGFKDGELYCWYEQYAKHQQNRDFIAEVDSTGLAKQYTIKADSAEPDKVAEWRAAGYENCFPTEKVPRSANHPGSFKRAIDYLSTLPKIHVHRTRCPNLAREIVRFRRRQLKDGTVLDNEFVEIDDDTVAALRYAVDDLVADVEHSHFFIKRKRA